MPSPENSNAPPVPCVTLHQVVAQGLFKMLARQLDYSPAAEELPMTVQVMVEDFQTYGLTDVDADRVEAAFMFLGPRIQRWPTARTVIEALPKKPAPKLLSQNITPERREFNLRQIGALVKAVRRKQ